MPVTEIMYDVHIEEEREQLFTQLYEGTFSQVARFVANRGGSFQDSKDIFHDALVILYEKMVHQKLGAEVKPEFYLVGIAKHLWIRKFKDDHKKVALDDIEKNITVPENYFETSENRLTSLLELTGRKCLELLRAFYYDNLPLQQIKTAFGFSSVHSASVQKYKCVEKLRNTIQQRSMDYEDFT